MSQCHNKHREYRNVGNNDSLLDFAGGNTNVALKSVTGPKNNVIDDLGEIFSTDNASSTAETLKPFNLMSNGKPKDISFKYYIQHLRTGGQALEKKCRRWLIKIGAEHC